MKKFAAALMIAGAGLIAGAAVVDAYPPGSAAVSVDDPTPVAGSTFTATVTGCLAGETVDFAFEGQTASATCVANGTAAFMLGFLAIAPSAGNASANFTAPTTPGAYTGTARLVTSNVTLSFTVTVQAAATTTVAGNLPETGSSSGNTTMVIASILLLAGAGMFGVAHLRRRQTLTT